MADQDSYVQVATDGSGKKIDNSTLTREDATVVYRQRVVISSDENPRQQAEIRGEAGQAYLMVESKTLEEIHGCLSEIRDMLKLLLV